MATVLVVYWARAIYVIEEVVTKTLWFASANLIREIGLSHDSRKLFPGIMLNFPKHHISPIRLLEDKLSADTYWEALVFVPWSFQILTWVVGKMNHRVPVDLLAMAHTASYQDLARD